LGCVFSVSIDILFLTEKSTYCPLDESVIAGLTRNPLIISSFSGIAGQARNDRPLTFGRLLVKPHSRQVKA